MGPETRGAKTIYITSVPYTVNKSTLVERIADVALARKLPPLRRRPGPVDRRRADRARAEEGRRREDGDGVPLQAHAAADQLPGQPDLPVPDREPGGRPARASRSAPDALALPPLPARGRHPAAGARARGAQEAHPHPRRLREGLRRARRDPQDRPQVRRQGRRGAADHQALRARRRADRRDPRAEDLPPGAARDSRHPEGARREAQARAADRRPAEERREPLGDRPRGNRSRSRRSTATRAGRRSPATKGRRSTPPTTSSSRKTTS